MEKIKNITNIIITLNKIIINSIISFIRSIGQIRVLSALCVVSGCFCGIYAVTADKDLTAASLLVASFLTPSFIGKAYQKKFEKSPDMPQT